MAFCCFCTLHAKNEFLIGQSTIEYRVVPLDNTKTMKVSRYFVAALQYYIVLFMLRIIEDVRPI